ncbi:hypothetical protein PY365_29195 [Roseiarcaceae bacterium H3SJ34-1]|uniref:hypothetical protein n=1 Tax=Terripilifer ovatus TaxID=3032367 RepID=UPI003AB9B8C3|nr:hypothetical protein [Roseiarcaceae bacterium H3SJ34-1]
MSCIRDQFIDDEQQIAFSRLFGDLELQPATRANKARSPFPEIFNVTGLILVLADIGLIVLFLLAIWNLFRVIRGLVRAIDGKRIVDPAGFI